jgi:DNA adenine methylase
MMISSNNNTKNKFFKAIDKRDPKHFFVSLRIHRGIAYKQKIGRDNLHPSPLRGLTRQGENGRFWRVDVALFYGVLQLGMMAEVVSRPLAQDALPFVKWMGGKRNLLDSLEPLFPPALKDGHIHTYCEPFLGGGAIFLHLASQYAFERIYLSDVNPDLVMAYQVVRDHIDQLITQLQQMAEQYFALDPQAQADTFQATRSAFNQTRTSAIPPDDIDARITHTTHFIFLNKTCYGGMFRVNSKGHFNVPFGKHKRPQIVNEPNLRRVSTVLQGADIALAPYHALPSDLDDGCFVYFDPPYRPLTQTSSFTRYHGDAFTDEDQATLATLFRKYDQRDVALMLSNSDPTQVNPNDRFFDELYEGFHIQRIHALRKINSTDAKRGRTAEIVITNYPTPCSTPISRPETPQLTLHF